MYKLTGPYHDFWVFSESERSPHDFWPLLGRKDAPLRVEDDLLHEFGHSLGDLPTEIPTGDPSRKKQILRMESSTGLDWYGPTILRGESTLLLAKRARSWCETHAEGGESIVLQIVPTWYPDATECTTQLTLPRAVLLSRIGRLAELAEQASKPDHYLLHLGI